MVNRCFIKSSYIECIRTGQSVRTSATLDQLAKFHQSNNKQLYLVLIHSNHNMWWSRQYCCLVSW